MGRRTDVPASWANQAQTNKHRGGSPTGHDDRQRKLEEVIDAFF
jgi:hypothetical protein